MDKSLTMWKVGDIVKHMFNEAYPRGVVLQLNESMTAAMIQWANGDILTCPLEEIEPLGWNLYSS